MLPVTDTLFENVLAIDGARLSTEIIARVTVFDPLYHDTRGSARLNESRLFDLSFADPLLPRARKHMVMS